MFALGGYARCGPRLAALTWGAEDLAVALGAAANVDEHGEWLPPYQLARSLCLLAAAAAGVPALDTVCLELRDEQRLARQAAAARRDGFMGKLAIHPAQVDVLNHAFRPHADEIEAAQRIVAAFEAVPGAGTVALDGKMVDRPHLTRARRTLERRGRARSSRQRTSVAGGAAKPRRLTQCRSYGRWITLPTRAPAARSKNGRGFIPRWRAAG